MKLRPGMTLAIEPMVNEGSYDVVWLDDDWTVVTEDGSLAAHYENTIVIPGLNFIPFLLCLKFGICGSS